MRDRVALGVIGYGFFAELLHERVLRGLSRLEVTAVCELDPERRRRGEEQLGAPGFDSAEAMLASGACDAVAIFTPHSTHRELAEFAAARGADVFCEKAMAVTSADCLAMMRAAEAAGVALVVGHMQKLFPPYRRLAELVRGGAYGAPVAAEVHGLHWCPVFEGWWRRKRDCGGLLYWTGIHDLDTLRHVMGAEPETAFAVCGPETDGYTDYEDSIAVTLTYANGATAAMQVAQHDPLRSFERSFSMSVVCERGAVAFDPQRDVVMHAGRDGLEAGPVTEEPFPPHEEAMYVAYAAEFEHFTEVVLDGAPNALPGLDGLRCVQTLEAIYASAASGVPVPVAAVPAGVA